MEYEFHTKPSYTMATVALESGESLTAEAGAMVSHSETISIDTGRGDSGGFLSSVKRSVLGDESFFRNTFTAVDAPGEVSIAPLKPGDMDVFELEGESMIVQSGGYVAAGGDVEITTDVGGLDTLFGGEGLFFLKATGTGPLFLGSYGGLVEREVGAGESFTVDSGHLVAWDDTMDYDTRRVGGLKETLLSGEGLVMEFEGPGTLWMQTRDYDAFIMDIASNLPNQNSN
jgi:uncharacterized protein (TIGR00266 family)